MRITGERIWCVRDPGPLSELDDIVFNTSFAKLPEYVVGTGIVRFRLEQHEFYDSYEEAVEDGVRRLTARQPRPLPGG